MSENLNPILIGIAGGTGSGKSTFTDRLKAMFGDEVTVIYHDNYYRAHDDIPFELRKIINYDHPDSLETELLLEHIKALKAGESVQCPVYDFSQHNRSKDFFEIKPSNVIILEGILIMADEQLRDLMDIRIFVDADADERILRRVRRDMVERGRDIDNIMDQYLTTVKPMHYRYIEPTRYFADIVINSGMNEVAFDLVATKIRALLDEKSKQ